MPSGNLDVIGADFMLNNSKREKLLAGFVAAIMTVSVAGCRSSPSPVQFVGPKVKPKGYVEPEQPQNEEYEEYSTYGGSHKFFYGSSYGRALDSSSIRSTSKTNNNSSKLGSTGSAGKSGIGSGMSRSSGSAIS